MQLTLLLLSDNKHISRDYEVHKESIIDVISALQNTSIDKFREPPLGLHCHARVQSVEIITHLGSNINVKLLEVQIMIITRANVIMERSVKTVAAEERVHLPIKNTVAHSELLSVCVNVTEIILK